ncbi:hypothetical protein [Candidatus Chlamydia sanziniae]|uniref:Uncharacterized protein n=1 Tax=Candidatus Chlamydia sanziniae TaxID=1806891 RepID=A0A1A9HXL7_9CHLA|nr:hypothetical protein [Candidatus Chlamydia sanziniae]ANH78832.1 hypothetical protein Cs308_0662 [Candidatus Chlamydia sanziniae]
MSTNTIKHFIPYASRWRPILEQIASSNDCYRHAQWINTLSFLENNGAKKISSSQHPTEVKQEVLKHAAEEFRHAYYLKSQIPRITNIPFPNYTPQSLIGGLITKYYLHLLDLKTCSVLKNNYHLSGQALKTTAYVLVTYAIELRASELYTIYHEILSAMKSKITIKPIIMEEQEHLAEMEHKLSTIPHGKKLLGYSCKFEAELCLRLVNALEDRLLKKHSIDINL